MKQKNNHSLTGRTQAKHVAKGTGNRLPATLLMLCLVLTVPCISGLAETAGAVSDNSAAETETTGTSCNTITDGNGESGDSRDNAVSDNAIPVLPESETGMPSNPVHHHTGKNDGTDTTTWSYVYFGSYPQGEVTDEATKTAIDNAIGEGNGQPAGTAEKSEGIDVWIGDIKYRRISKEDCNNRKNFDNVKNNGYRYFKWERIKWRVLQNDGSTLFVATDMAVDCKCYNDAYAGVTWETCTLRKWLNDSFYKNAFSSAEQGAIVAQTVVNEDNLTYGTEGGNDTLDKVYLLSSGEVANETYGFCSSYRVYSDSRRLKTSDYANARGAARSTSSDFEANGWWSLRSLGGWNSISAYVYDSGYVNGYGGNVAAHDVGTVPVLHINLFPDGNTIQTASVKVSKISLTGISKKIAAGKKIKLTAEVFPENATDKAVTWTSSDTGYATVGENGTVTTKKAGAGKSVIITASAKDGSGVKAQYQIKLMKGAVKKVKITAPSKTVKAGKKLKLKAAVTTTGKNANKKLKWTSSNESYATVSASGVVKAAKAGKGKTVTITAMATDGTGKKAKIKIKIQ